MLLGIVGAIGCIFLEYFKAESFKEAAKLQSGSYSLGALLPFAIIVFFILAARGIRKDQKLVKSLDRLR